jgi:hypothetical protein
MRFTNKHTGSSFNLSPKEAADFFYAKNAKGKFINHSEDYIIQDPKTEISTFKFFLGCLGVLTLCYACFYLFLQFNY